MATLSMRHEQLSALTRTKRLYWSSSCIGLVSLIGVCVAVLPWGIARTQGEYVAVAIVAASSFAWMTVPIAASGSMGLYRRMLSAWWALLVAAAAHLALSIYLEYSIVEDKDDWVEDCHTSDPTWSADACSTRADQLVLAFPLIAAILPLGAIPLLFLLRRSFAHLPQNTRYNSLMDDDLPPGWHVPPAQVAPDSSASDSEDGALPASVAGSPRRTSRTRVGSDKDTGSDWYELGKKGHRSSRSLAGATSWSEVRRARKERNLAKARASS
ncbi:hypothetical protein JCM10450v2_005498 [Rhodotorula kratochvilovae]